jgi:hypothetical protein
MTLMLCSHTPFAGSANIQAGITIDLALVNDIAVAENQSSVHIGVGNRWGAVNHILDPLNLATATGRISGVGVGGFVSGGDILNQHPLSKSKHLIGGMSFYSPRMGLVCDAALNFDVTLSTSDGVIRS